jgi:(1->4)-alpha-D-glucan 1-alpha-D-glucosylmutase
MLTATYRLQMNAGFTLTQARERVEYFATLGVSHLYLSPIFAARRGSMHGYDVVDPTRVNPEIGTEADLRVLSQNLHRHGMGLVLDVVPNHMGIGRENPYWDDVLANGERSRYARWFDIDWIGGHAAHRKVTLPVLGDELDAVVDRGELSVELVSGATPRIRYFAHSFPLDPTTLPSDLQLASTDPEEARELADAYAAPEGRTRLRALLDRQHYRLDFWRRGPREINYRRFFDVNELAALRMEDPLVFAATHDFVLRLVREGIVDGLRIDHIDGLLDPAGYLERLRTETRPETLLYVEKILSAGEELPAAWPVQGTTGYEFLNDLEDVFVDADGFAQIDNAYRRMRLPQTATFHEIARAGKARVLRGALHADVDRVVALIAPAPGGPGPRWPANEIADALIEFIAALPVYRSYVGPDGRSGAVDRTIIESAVSDARAASAHPDIVAWIGDVMLDHRTDGDVDAAARLQFVQRVQQLSGPAAAKGVEDTALYDYVPLACRNEVGGAPDRPLDGAVQRLHRANERRAAHHPLALLATNTHDTKRSADARARLETLSEMPEEWERAIGRWRVLNDGHRQQGGAHGAPDANTEYLLYQTLVALWPSPPDLCERVTKYIIKAAREAKVHTSWVNPDQSYEQALERFVGRILAPSNTEFLGDLAHVAECAAQAGARNALSRVAVHLTSPGTPDIYQGDELRNFALVDPDNRRQVNYDLRAALLGDLAAAGDPVSRIGDDALSWDGAKLLVTHRLLALRRAQPELFTRGSYRPLVVHGSRAAHAIAFARSINGRHAVTVASRLTLTWTSRNPAEWWGDTSVQLPDDMGTGRWRDAITGATISIGGMVAVSALLDKLPVAVIGN